MWRQSFVPSTQKRHFVSVLFYQRFLFSINICSEARRETPRGSWGVNAASVARERRADGKRLTTVWPVGEHTPSDLNLPKHRAARSDHFHLLGLSVPSFSCWVYKGLGGNKQFFIVGAPPTCEEERGRRGDMECVKAVMMKPGCVLQAQSSDLSSCAQSAAHFSAIKENILTFQPLYVQIRSGLPSFRPSCLVFVRHN